jgi:hypothetical protein
MCQRDCFEAGVRSKGAQDVADAGQLDRGALAGHPIRFCADSTVASTPPRGPGPIDPDVS